MTGGTAEESRHVRRTATCRAWRELLAGGCDHDNAAALVYDQSNLQYISTHDFPDSTDVLNATFHRQDHVIAVPAGLKLREDLNRDLHVIIGSDLSQETLNRYLGEAMR